MQQPTDAKLYCLLSTKKQQAADAVKEEERSGSILHQPPLVVAVPTNWGIIRNVNAVWKNQNAWKKKEFSMFFLRKKLHFLNKQRVSVLKI